MAEDSNMEQQTSDASTADISHPDVNMTNAYNNHDSNKKKPVNERKERKKSRASLASIQVILLDEEEFACQVDVSVPLFHFRFLFCNQLFFFFHREILKEKMFSTKCAIT